MDNEPTEEPRTGEGWLDRAGVLYTSRSEGRRKLTRRAEWALWAFCFGTFMGFLMTWLL